MNDFVVKIHILYVALPFTFFVSKARLWIQIVNLNVTFLVRLFVKKPCYFNKNIFGSLSTTC